MTFAILFMAAENLMQFEISSYYKKCFKNLKYGIICVVGKGMGLEF